MTPITDKQAQVKLCRYFFDNYCVKRKTLKGSFGKSTIEHFFGTYIQQSSFLEAFLLTDTNMSNDKYGELKFDIVIENQFKHKVLFIGSSTALLKWNQLNNIQ